MEGFGGAGGEAFETAAGEATAAFLLSLRALGIRHTGVLRAMERVPRGSFAPRRFADLARSDLSVPLACGQTMTAPSAVAQMLVALDPQPGQSALEIGTGSGYVAALLAEIGLSVRTLERYRSLALAAHERFAALGVRNVEALHADGFQPPRSPALDRILLNGVVEAVPEALVSRLAPGGRLVAALRIEGLSRLVVVVRWPEARSGHSTVNHQLGGPLRLPPLVSGLARAL